MKDNNYKQHLRDPEEIPNDDLFKKILSKQLLQTYQEIQKTMSDMKLFAEWRFYNDGKSWLWKITARKKTIVWISLWENHFKSSFYFTEKHQSGIEGLNISADIKAAFSKTKPTGKLTPVILYLKNVSDLENFKQLIDYKLSLK